MLLYRIIAEEEWIKAKSDGFVPRCNSDKRDDCVHLTKFEDIELVANKYFVKEEKPVVLEIDVSDIKKHLFWQQATDDKPWEQPNLKIDNIPFGMIKRYCYLLSRTGKSNDFKVDAFITPLVEHLSKPVHAVSIKGNEA